MFLVSEKDRVVEGFIIGILDLVYPCVEELMVTDLIFAFTDDGPPRDAAIMVGMMIRWAESSPKVVEVHLGVTDALSGDQWKRVGQLYKHLGLDHCGGMYRMIIDRQQQEIANV